MALDRSSTKTRVCLYENKPQSLKIVFFEVKDLGEFIIEVAGLPRSLAANSMWLKI